MHTSLAPALAQAAFHQPRIRVLLVEDNPGDARLVQLHMEDCAGFTVDHAATIADALVRCAEVTYDVVLLDLSLPDAQGPDAFRAMRAGAPTLPIVILTGLNDEDLARRMLQSGAQDYVLKGVHLGSRSMCRILTYAVERHQLLTEVQAARARESEQKDRFLAHVSHELRSPLAVAYLYTTNVHDGIFGDLSAEQREHLLVAVEALRAQKRLVDDLLAAVRSDANIIAVDRVPLSLFELIPDALAQFGSHRDGKQVVTELQPRLPLVHADAHRIRQVLTNLLDNALKYSPPGGIVRITATAVEERRFVQVDIDDSGPGIPEPTRRQIFERLLRCNDAHDGPNGLGLGLYLAHLIVTRHGGRIWLDRSAADGSRFSFTLPCAPPAPGDLH